MIAEHGDRPALYAGDRVVTFAELAGMAAAVQREVEPGERVGVASGRSVGHVAAVLGVLAGGATLVPLEPRWRVPVARELSPHERAPVDVLPRVESDAPALALYTSGSTGVPKGVLIDRGALRHRLRALAEVMPYAADDVCCLRTPLTFIDAYSEMLGPLLAGVPSVVLPEPLAIGELAHALESRRVTRVLLVPSLLARLVELRPVLPASLRLIAASGEPLSADLAARVHAASRARLVNIYGSTEVAGDASYADVAPGDAVTIGVPLPGVAMRIVDGELQVAGPVLARGYAGDDELTARRFVVDAGERWFRTGDRARRLEDGRFVVEGRLDGQVKIHGVRVELAEVEAALRAVPGVLEAAAAVHAGRIVAGVVGSAVDPATLGLREAATPRVIAVLPDLPTTAHGKRDRDALVARILAATERARVAPASALEARVCAWFERLTGSAAGPDDDFVALGGDSMARLGLLVELERAGWTLAHAELPSPLTARRLAAMVATREKAGARAVPAATGRFPVTDFQRVMVLDTLANRGTPIWLEQLAYTLHADVDPDRFARAWRDELAAQPALRTRFHVGADVEQEIADDASVSLDVIDARHLVLDAYRLRVKAEEWTRISIAFDLAEGPLFAVCLARGADRCDLIFTYHHAILDGTSARAVLRSVLERYAGRTPHPRVATSFRAVCEQARAAPDPLRAQLAGYVAPALVDPAPPGGGDLTWRLFHDLLGLRGWLARRRVRRNAARLPLRHEPAVYAGGDVTSQPVPKLVDDAILAWARAHGITATAVWAAAFALHLARAQHGRDVVFGMMFSGRDGASAETVGMLATCLPVRVRLPADATPAAELVRAVAATLAELERAASAPMFDLGLDPRVWIDTMMTTWRFPPSTDPAVPTTNGRGLSMYAPHTGLVVSDRELAAGARSFHQTDRIRRDVLALVEAIASGAATVGELLAARVDEGGLSIAQPRL